MSSSAKEFIKDYWQQLGLLVIIIIGGTQFELRVRYLENLEDTDIERRLASIETMANPENMRVYGQLQKQVEVNAGNIASLDAAVNNLYTVSKRIPFSIQ